MLAGIACIGGLPGALMENVGMIIEPIQIHTIKHTPGSHQGHTGVTGTSQESRSIGAGEEKIIQ